MIKVDFGNLIRQLLPWYKRTPVRMALLSGFLSPLRLLFNDFTNWCGQVRRRVNVTSQVALLEGYLSDKVGRPVSIRIETFDDGLVEVYLEIEGLENTMSMSLLDEEQCRLIDIPLYGELRENFGDVDFIIYVPNDIDIEQIRAEVERYRQAGTRYKIIQMI